MKTFSYKCVFVNQQLSPWTVQTRYNLLPETCCETPSVSDLFQTSLFLSIVSLPVDTDCWKGEVSKVSTYLLRKRYCFSLGFLYSSADCIEVSSHSLLSVVPFSGAVNPTFHPALFSPRVALEVLAESSNTASHSVLYHMEERCMKDQ